MGRSSLVILRKPKDIGSRLWSAYRRVGLRGLWDDLRWRFRVASGGRGVVASIGSGLRLIVTSGPRELLRRVRFGTRVFVSASGTTSDPGLYPWTATFAHDAAFNAHFDLDLATLEANREIVEGFGARSSELRTATWFLTYFDHVLFGGVHTILRLMDYMARLHGVIHRLVLFDRTGVKDEEIRRVIAGAFPALERVDIVLPVDGEIPYDELPYSDIAVATMWISAYPLARFNKTGAKFYMVQDFEPAFYPAGSLSALAEATYRLGFAGIVNTPGLAAVYRSYGHDTVEFTPAVDYLAEDIEKPSSREGSPVQVVVYGRPSTDRNAFELVASACSQLKETYGDRVRVVSAGEDWDPEELGLEGIIENRGRLTNLDEIRRLYRDSDIGVCFMLSKHPSYQPFEYLASYVVPVCNVNAATNWFLRDEENCLITEPFPSAVARTIGRLVDDEEFRHMIAEAGHAEVAQLDWDEEFERVWRFVANRA